MRFSNRFFFILILFPLSSPFLHVSGVPYLDEWGIYELDLSTKEVQLIYSDPSKLDNIKLNLAGDTFTFALYLSGDDYESTEIYTLDVDGTGLKRLTDNDVMDVFPSWSPDGGEMVFLSWRDATLDIWIMESDGGNQRLLYDSGYHDADVHWIGDTIVFTRNSQIWAMDSDGSNPRQLTDPPKAGEWRDAILPFGDYDPRISPDGSKVAFERMVDDTSQHGNYDLFLVNIDGSGEVRLTETGWTQGIAAWSSNGETLTYLVSAKGSEGVYDIYTIKSDGSKMTDQTSDIFPDTFLAHSVIFSLRDTIYFVGQWWGWTPLETTLTCATVKTTVQLGSTITILGTIEPRFDDAEIKLTIDSPDGSEETYVIHAADGKYSHEFEASILGDWSVDAHFEGDAGHLESQRTSVEFSVVEPSLSNDDSNGVPGLPPASMLIGIIVLIFFRTGLFTRSGGESIGI